jgi:hypothetical protein
MPQGNTSSHADKQKRQAAHIEAGCEKNGVGRKTTAGRAWVTVGTVSSEWRTSGFGRNGHKQSDSVL